MKVPKIIPLILAAFFLPWGFFALGQSDSSMPQMGKMGAQQKPGMMDQKMKDRCEAMMAKQKEMMSEMKAMDARLDHKVAAMNAATGSEKVETMAAVINELVSQRKEMHEKMMAMHAEMMSHMMEHMGMEKMQGMHKSMSECPMMKGMQSGSSKPGTEKESQPRPQGER